MIRARFPGQGLRDVVRFNWPWFLGAAFDVLVLGVAGFVTSAPWNILCWVLVGLVVTQVFIALLAVHQGYDRSGLYEGRWLGEEPCELLLVTAGFDRTSRDLVTAGHTVHVRDLHRGLPSLTRSLRRAVRDRSEGPAASEMSEPEGVDVVLFMLSAHELRDPATRVEEFKRARECVGPVGRILVVEHIRGLGVWLAFGPAAGHFFPLRTWEATAAKAGLEVRAVHHIALLVSCLELGPSSSPDHG